MKGTFNMKTRLKNLLKNYDTMDLRDVAKELSSIFWKIQYSLQDPKKIAKKNKANSKKRWDKEDLGVAFSDNILTK